jgi:hypothetical protein
MGMRQLRLTEPFFQLRVETKQFERDENIRTAEGESERRTKKIESEESVHFAKGFNNLHN